MFSVDGEEPTVYRRYLAVQDRRVAYPDGRLANFDIVGHPKCDYQFAVVFPFHADGTVTLLREFAQAALPGPPTVYSLPCGGYDPRRHRDVAHAAASELSEEALLEGEVTPLLRAAHPGVLEAKWCRNRFTPYLCIEPTPAASPDARDFEEHCEVLRLPIAEVRALMLGGEMLLPSVQTCALAFDALERRGLTPAVLDALPTPGPTPAALAAGRAPGGTGSTLSIRSAAGAAAAAAALAAVITAAVVRSR